MSNVSSTSRPTSPTKLGAPISNVLKPNPHPYAIKTTATGILSRSSSSSSSAHSHNHYVPVSPLPSPTKQHYTDYTEREYRHRYSRSFTDENNARPLSVPSEDLYYQQHRHSSSITGPLSESFNNSMNPKLWTCEQLAENVPEIADFVLEHEITGRGFLRFDNGVLDAYGITQHSRRSLILNHSLRLRQSMLRNRNLNTFKDLDAERLPHPNSSHYTGQHRSSLDEDDLAYLSSSSSISSASSSCERTKRRSRPNGRVHGMVASYERSTSPEKAQLTRDRSDSASSIQDERFLRPQYNGGIYRRPLPFAPQSTVEHAEGPLLLPQTLFSNSFPSSLNTPHPTGSSSQVTPHATGYGVDHTAQPTDTLSRPLPATPLHPSLRPLLNENLANNPAIALRSTSGEMTMDELNPVLDTDTESFEPHAFVNIDRRKARKISKENGAWEINIGETVKHVPPTASSTIVKAQAQAQAGDDELTVEELLALEGEVGATAWMKESEGIGQTMKRVDNEWLESKNARSGSIGRSKSVGAVVECIPLGAGRRSRGYGKQQVRRAGELFLPERRMEGEKEQNEMGALALEHMREVEKQLLRVEKERQRWVEEIAKSHNWENTCAKESEPRRQGEESWKADEEMDLSRKQQRLKEETQHGDHGQQRNGLAEAERQRQEDVEQRLVSSIAENRWLLEEFRIRLERVEQRVEDLGTAPLSCTSDSPSLQTHDDPNACALQRLRTIAAWALSTPLGVGLPAVLGVSLADFLRGPKASMTRLVDEATETAEDHRDKSRTVVSLYSKTLPRYAILFGFGICAFMLRGLMRWGFKGVRGVGAVGARGMRGR